MDILLIGGSGNVGQRIVKEALSQGYSVTSAQRHPANVHFQHPKLKVIKGDLLNEHELPWLLEGYEVIISAIAPTGGLTTGLFKKANENLINVLKYQDNRLIVVGGAGCLEVAPGIKVMDSPIWDQLPEDWKPDIIVHNEVLELYKNSDLNWTYFSPAKDVQAGVRTGKFKLGTTNLIFDENGGSSISYEDYAVALIDEIKNKKFMRQQFSIGY
jgi:hypothetical protein